MYKLQAYTAAADRIWDTVEESTLLDPEFRYSDISETRKDFIVRDFFEACGKSDQQEIIGEATFDDPKSALWGCLHAVRRYLEPHLDEYLTDAIHGRAISYLNDEALRVGA